MSAASDRTVLLVEDVAGDARLFREYLGEAHPGRGRWNVELVESLAAARAALEESSPDLIVTDLGLPESRGLDTFRTVREAAGGIPVVVLTGLADGETGRRAVVEGAQDFLVKGELTPALLARSMEYAVERARMAREAEQREAAAHRADRLAVIGRLVGGVAHEFNNLLTAMLGYAQLLESDPGLNADQRESVGEILVAARRASEVTRQLLAYSRRQILKPAPVDLNASLRELKPLLESTLGRGVALRLDLEDDLPAARADRGELEHALVHLLNNARDAMRNGGEVAISTTSATVADGDEKPVDLGGYVVLEVRDDGVGMDAETLRRAREPFFTTRPFGEAAGLGLATVDGIADQIGGGLELESRPGEGTTARVYLPVAGEEPG